MSARIPSQRVSPPVLNGGPDDAFERAAEERWEARNHPPAPRNTSGVDPAPDYEAGEWPDNYRRQR